MKSAPESKIFRTRVSLSIDISEREYEALNLYSKGCFKAEIEELLTKSLHKILERYEKKLFPAAVYKHFLLLKSENIENQIK